MNIAEWILVAILSLTLIIFLILGIILLAKLIGITKEAKKIVIKGQDIAESTSGIVNNVKGMTSIGGVVQTFADKYVDPKFKKDFKDAKEAKETKKSAKTSEKDK